MELDLLYALALSDHVLVLDAHDTTTPVLAGLFVVVVLLTEVNGELLKILVVFLVDFGEGNASSGLHVAKLTEVGLSAHEAVWDVLFAAESGQVNHALNGVDVVSNDHELGGTLFDKSGDVVKTELEVNGLSSLGVSLGLSLLLEAVLLFLLGLGLVLGQELEDLGGLVLVNSVRELVDGWWDLESLEQDALLSLDAHVLGPFDETGQVLLEDDVTTDSEVLGRLLEKGGAGVLSLIVINNNLLAFGDFLNLSSAVR